jgi:hypothetical protein
MPRPGERLRFLFSVLLTLIVGSIVLVVVQDHWPPHWLELAQQRHSVAKRVRSIGGWEVLCKECVALSASGNPYRYESRYPVDDLPPALTALKPMRIQYVPVQYVMPSQVKLKIVHIQFFGSHSTGGHEVPLYGLDVLCEPEPKDFWPEQMEPPVVGPTRHFLKITEGVYEVYDVYERGPHKSVL